MVERDGLDDCTKKFVCLSVCLPHTPQSKPLEILLETMPSIELSELHHLFIHALLLRRLAPYEKCLEVWMKSAEVIGVRVADNEFAQFYGQINDRIESFGFRIALLSDEGNGPIDMNLLPSNPNSSTTKRLQTKRWMALVNTRSDDTAKLGTDLNPNEIAFYKKIVDQIILSANYRYCISYHDALRLSSTLDSALKKTDAERLLKVLIKKGWLSQSSTGYFSLSIRAKLELQSYIQENYAEEDRPPACASCRELVMRGFKCPNAQCPKAMHVVCAMNQSRHSNSCPSCKSRFSYEIKIGEDAPRGESRVVNHHDLDDENEDLSSQMESQPVDQRRPQRTHRYSNESQSMGDAEPPSRTPSKTQSRSQPQRKSARHHR